MDCILIPIKDEYFFDCKEMILTPNHLLYLDLQCIVNHVKKIVNPFQSKPTIQLPNLFQVNLTALQSNNEFGVYATFDPETQNYVLDNCTNVHIWDDLSTFIPASYIKFSSTSTSVISAVNGTINLPAGCGDAPVKWIDDNGQFFKITLKNILHFPKSPVNIISIVGLAEQLKDDWYTWVLSCRHQSLFT